MIYDTHKTWRRQHKRTMLAVMFFFMVVSFIAGFFLCTTIWYEFPLWQTVYYEGYRGQPQYGHYSEFMDAFRIKE